MCATSILPIAFVCCACLRGPTDRPATTVAAADADRSYAGLRRDYRSFLEQWDGFSILSLFSERVAPKKIYLRNFPFVFWRIIDKFFRDPHGVAPIFRLYTVCAQGIRINLAQNGLSRYLRDVVRTSCCQRFAMPMLPNAYFGRR